MGKEDTFTDYRRSAGVCQRIFTPRLIALDGETTRRASLNLDRGSGTLDAQHIVRKREPQRETVKSRTQQDGSEGHLCVIV